MADEASNAWSPVGSAKRRRRVTSVAFLTGAIVLACGGLLIVPVRQLRDASHREACRARLHEIGLALHAYHDEYDSFPPAYMVDTDGRAMHSWRVLLLPYLGQQELYAEYRFDEPWDGPHNRQLAERMPEVFACPQHAKAGIANYLAVVGKETAWPEDHPASIHHILDGASSTIQVVEQWHSDVSWTEPRDISFADVEQTLQVAAHPPGGKVGIQFLLLADGSVRSMSIDVDRQTYRWLFTARNGFPFPGVDWPLDPSVGMYDFAEVRDAGDLPQTEVVPYRAAPITSGRNVAYCATFQLAWDDFRTVVGGPVQLDGDPLLAAAMNAESFPRESLSPDSYVARGGMMRDGIVDEILDEMSRKFPDAQPQLLATRPSDVAVVMYAYLRKILPFAEQFDRLPDPLMFNAGDGASPVTAFGLPKQPREALMDKVVREQVTVLDYADENDFIIRLDTQGRDDEILLAKITPGPTLDATLATVTTRIDRPDPAHDRSAFKPGEELGVPVLTLNVRREYQEIIGLDIHDLGLFIHRAAQIIRFRLDERGAHLVSEVEIIGENGHGPPERAPQPRRFVFDRPFLIALQERGAGAPYFAAWIGNTELMERR